MVMVIGFDGLQDGLNNRKKVLVSHGISYQD